MPTPFALVTLRAVAHALVLARRANWPESARRARAARTIRYARARGLRGPSSSTRARVMAARIAEDFAAADRH